MASRGAEQYSGLQVLARFAPHQPFCLDTLWFGEMLNLSCQKKELLHLDCTYLKVAPNPTVCVSVCLSFRFLYIVQAALKIMSLVPQPLDSWYYKQVPYPQQFTFDLCS